MNLSECSLWRRLLLALFSPVFMTGFSLIVITILAVMFLAFPIFIILKPEFVSVNRKK